ncbi:MAG: hypothetical protein RLZZ360_864 [Candidatus Parcubacteria bacterium]|jgi:hypothetical protein
MKSWIIAGGCFGLFNVSGVLVVAFSMPVEYMYPKPEAHIAGVVPSQIEHWEMY